MVEVIFGGALHIDQSSCQTFRRFVVTFSVALED